MSGTAFRRIIYMRERAGVGRCRERRAGGFSLLELMVSIGILSVTLLLIMAVFTGSMRASQKSTDLTAGVIVAETVLTKEVNDIITKGSGQTADGKTIAVDETYKAALGKLTGGSPGVLCSGIKLLNNTTFVWELSVTPIAVSAGGSSSSGADSGFSNDLVKLDATVWWGDSGAIDALEAEERTSGKVSSNAYGGSKNEYNQARGMGILRCEMSRLYNVSQLVGGSGGG